MNPKLMREKAIKKKKKELVFNLMKTHPELVQLIKDAVFLAKNKKYNKKKDVVICTDIDKDAKFKEVKITIKIPQ